MGKIKVVHLGIDHTNDDIVSTLDLTHHGMDAQVATFDPKFYATLQTYKYIIKQISPDIIHTHSHLARVAAFKYAKCKRVHTIYSLPRMGFFERLRKNTLSHMIIAASAPLQKAIDEMGIKNVHTIYNGVHPASLHAEDELIAFRRQYDIADNAFVVTCAAKLFNSKDYILDTAKELPYNVIVFVMDAEDECKKQILSCIKEEKLHNVRVLADISDASKLISVSAVLINGYTETATALLLQGMSLGKPVISQKCDDYVVEDGINGIIIPWGDTDALDDAITRLKDDKELYDKLSSGAIEHYQFRFTASQMATEMAQVYRQVLQMKG